MFTNRIWIPSRHPENRIQIREHSQSNIGEFTYNNNRYRVVNFNEINPNNPPIVDKQRLYSTDTWKDLTQSSCIHLQSLEVITRGCFSTEDNLTRTLNEITPPRSIIPSVSRTRPIPAFIQNINRRPARSSHHVEQLGSVLQNEGTDAESERNVRRRIDFSRAPDMSNSRLIRNLADEFKDDDEQSETERENEDLTTRERGNLPNTLHELNIRGDIHQSFEERKRIDDEARQRMIDDEGTETDNDEEEKYEELTRENKLSCENVRSEALIEPLYKTIHKDICIFISITSTDIKSYCYPLEYIQSLFTDPEVYEWISYREYIEGGKAITFLPVVKLPEQGVFIDVLSSRMALMFNTFVVEDLSEKRIGSFFAVSALHGAKELIRTLRPIPRSKYLEITNESSKKVEEINKLLKKEYISSEEDVYDINNIGWKYNINRNPLAYAPYYTRSDEILEKSIEISLIKEEYQITYEFGFNRFVIKLNDKELFIEQLMPRNENSNTIFETNIIAQNGKSDEALVTVESIGENIQIKPIIDSGFDVFKSKDHLIIIKGSDIQFHIKIWKKKIVFIREEEEETEEGTITRQYEDIVYLYVYDYIEVNFTSEKLIFNFRGKDGIVLKKS